MRSSVLFLTLALVTFSGCSVAIEPSVDAGPTLGDAGPTVDACTRTHADFEAAATAAACSPGYIANAWMCPWANGTATSSQLDACLARLSAVHACIDMSAALQGCRGL